MRRSEAPSGGDAAREAATLYRGTRAAAPASAPSVSSKGPFSVAGSDEKPQPRGGVDGIHRHGSGARFWPLFFRRAAAKMRRGRVDAWNAVTGAAHWRLRKSGKKVHMASPLDDAVIPRPNGPRDRLLGRSRCLSQTAASASPAPQVTAVRLLHRASVAGVDDVGCACLSLDGGLSPMSSEPGNAGLQQSNPQRELSNSLAPRLHDRPCRCPSPRHVPGKLSVRFPRAADPGGMSRLHPYIQ